MFIILVSALLIGCSTNETTTTNETAPSNSNESPSTETEPEQTNEASVRQEVEEFYKGKRITFIVPYDPGAGYDMYARMMVPFLEEYTGARIEVSNLPGAGGMRGVNELFRAPTDGTYIGILNGAAMVTNQISEIVGVDYDLGKFGYLGRVAADVRVLTMAADSPYQTFDDFLNSDKQIKLGATGLGGSTYVDAVLINEALGLDVHVIHGYDSVVDPAILRGEVDGTWGSLGSRLVSIEEGLTVPILQNGRERSAELPDVPTVLEYIDVAENKERALAIMEVWDSLNSVGRPIATPPGVPEERLAFLQEAFDKVMADERFIATAEQANRELMYASGEEMLEIAVSATDIPDEEVKQTIIQAITGEIK